MQVRAVWTYKSHVTSIQPLGCNLVILRLKSPPQHRHYSIIVIYENEKYPVYETENEKYCFFLFELDNGKLRHEGEKIVVVLFRGKFYSDIEISG